MRAVRLSGPGALDLVDIAEPEPNDGDAVLRVVATGICGSDLSCYATGIFAPVVLGHEVAGVIEDSGASRLKPGTAVVIDPKTACGDCDHCVAGNGNRCPSALTRGIGSGRQGGLAERVAVPAANLHAIGDIDPFLGCLAEPLSCAIHGLHRAGVSAADDVIVVGLGPIGLLTIAALRARNLAKRITGIDPAQPRRLLATTLGADDVVGPDAVPFGLEAPLVFECSGKSAGLRTATNVIAAGGRIALLGVPLEEATISPVVWVSREITLTGSIASTPADIDAAIAMLAAAPEIGAIVTDRIGLDGVADAMAQARLMPAGGKVVVSP